MSYIQKEIENIFKANPAESEFNQAACEVLESVRPLIRRNKIYESSDIIKRISEPDRQIKFKVLWKDDQEKIHINRGYRVQFNNALGPYKGGLRFHPTVNISVVKFLAFEQIFKNALTGLPIGGAKGGSDFNPKGKSDNEIMNFCQSFMNELFRYIGPDRDIPAGDMGVGEREIGYLFGQYKRIKNFYESGAISGKSISCGGSLVRRQATGYGLLYFTREMLKKHGREMNNLKVCISGSGNVAIYAAEKASQMGCKVVAMSDSSGYIYSPGGINVEAMKLVKKTQRLRISEYVKYDKSCEYHAGKFMWDVPCEIALPCATQNELDEECIKNLIKNNILALAEGANMPITLQGMHLLAQSSILYAPGKASNAGGVSVSALEMSQNSIRMRWSFDEVDQKLQNIMLGIFNNISRVADEYDRPGDYLLGANILGFKTVADAMISQGVV